MNKRLSIVLCGALLSVGATCGAAERKTVGLTLTKQVYKPRRFSAKRYQGTRYSPVKFTPRRYAWQRNLGKHVGFKPVPKPASRERNRLRPAVRGSYTRRRAATRRTPIRRRLSRDARIRTVRGGFGTGDG